MKSRQDQKKSMNRNARVIRSDNDSALPWSPKAEYDFSNADDSVSKDTGFVSLGRALQSLPSYDCLSGQDKSWALADLYATPVTFDEDLQSRALVHEALVSGRDILAWCAGVITASPTGRLMYKEAAAEKWRIGFDELASVDFHIDVPQKMIALDHQGFDLGTIGRSAYLRNGLLLAFVRALRDVWQEKRYGGFDETYGPESILLLERVRAADCDVLSVLCAWELRGEGYSDLWRHLIGSEDGDLAMTFSRTLDRDPSSLFTGKSLAATFDRWFASEDRVNACDHETLEYMDDILLSEGSGNPFGGARLTARDIEILSCMPDKTAYLRGYGENILRDPLYAGMDDVMNQTHLLHILHDLEVVYAGNVPFRDADLARRMFPSD